MATEILTFMSKDGDYYDCAVICNKSGTAVDVLDWRGNATRTFIKAGEDRLLFNKFKRELVVNEEFLTNNNFSEVFYHNYSYVIKKEIKRK